MNYLKCLFTVFLISSLQLIAQVDKQQLDAYIQQAVSNYELPGLAISIIKDDQVVYEKGFGFANIESKRELTADATFAIASLSKAFTATAIGMLVDEGKLKWTDKVSQYIEGFDLSDDYVASQMTIEDILAHRSGFGTFDGDLLWYSSDYSREEIINRFANYPMKYGFRTEYGYQNIMFIIAGEIVEKASGMPWEKFIETRIFKPLQMNNSYTSITEYPKDLNIAEPHVKGNLDEIRNYDNSGGAAAISSNVQDLSKWIRFWLNNGIVDGDTLLSGASYQNITNLQTPIDPSNFDKSNGINFKGYGLGWFLMDYQGAKVAHHGGGLPGYISKIFICPDINLGVVILTNGETALPASLMYHILDQYQGNKVQEDWAQLYLDFSNRSEKSLEKKQKERVTSRKAKIKSQFTNHDLVGSYMDKVYGEATVGEKGGKLIFTMLPAKELFSSEMEHWHYNTYRIRFKDEFLPDGYITFSQDAEGKVIGLKIDLPNPDFHFYKLDFVKE